MKEQLNSFTDSLNRNLALRDSHARCVKTAHLVMQGQRRSGQFSIKHLLGTAYALLLIATCSVSMCISAKASTPLPEDLQLIPADSLPAYASWYGTNFESHGIRLRDFLQNNSFLEKATFAPISMPPVP